MKDQKNFGKINIIREAILVKIENIMPENASFQGYFTKLSFDTSEGNQLNKFFEKTFV